MRSVNILERKSDSEGSEIALAVLRPVVLRPVVFRPVVLALVVALAALVSTGGAPVLAAGPQRIVSLNVCTDQILVDLVAPDRIAAVTHLATDPLSVAHPARAKGLPQTRGAAEDVLGRNPDLIIAGAYTTPATVALLRAVGRRVEVVAQPQSVSGIGDLIRDMARLVEAPERGAALIAAMTARLDQFAAARHAGPRPVALVYQVNNYVSASGSLIDEAMALAGFANGAAALTRSRNGQVSLEALLTAPPDLLVLASGPTTYRTAVADNLRHPALRDLAARVPATVIPWPLWLCGTHHIVDAVERLAALRR